MKKLLTITVISLFTTDLLFGHIAICKGCHGQNFEKNVMGKSKVVNNMTKEEILTALKGYKDGSYGGVMKRVMEDQVATLTEEDIATLINEIKE